MDLCICARINNECTGQLQKELVHSPIASMCPFNVGWIQSLPPFGVVTARLFARKHAQVAVLGHLKKGCKNDDAN